MKNEQFRHPVHLERVSGSVPISKISVIEESGILVRTKKQLAELVEAPLLEACEDLYDKNIQTVMSSANKGNIKKYVFEDPTLNFGGQAYIDIDFESLSKENKSIAIGLGGKLFNMHGFRPIKCVKITFPIDKKTTVGDVRRMAKEAISKFQLQAKTWG